ncbi:MAG: hypothetical protein P8X65_14180 [Syntrophobacterales bacterium]|jgi:hypothetical protein
MLGKKIIAVIIAALTLIKVAFLLISPEKWLGMAQAFIGHTALVMVVYLILLAITRYFIFTSIDIIDIFVVMGFTALLVGLSLLPYAASLQTTTQEIAATGIGKAWLALLIWVALALAVLYRVFAKER